MGPAGEYFRIGSAFLVGVSSGGGGGKTGESLEVQPKLADIVRLLAEGVGAGGGTGGCVAAGVARVPDVGGVGGDGGAAGGGGDEACTQQQSHDVARGTGVTTHSTLRSPPRSCRHRTRPASSTPSWW